jgi:hypothetical protein
MQLFDTHARPDQPEFDDGRDDAIARAREAHAANVVASGTAADTSQFARRRPWHAFTLLVFAYAAFNVLLNPMGASTRGDEFPTLILIGVMLVQPAIFAIWIALGPPPAAMRIPLTVAGLMFVLFAGCITQFSLVGDNRFNRISPTSLVMPLSQFVAWIVLMLLVRKVTRVRIENIYSDAGRLPSTNQFSLKYLLVLTMICAVLLAIGRGLTFSRDWPAAPSWQEIGFLISRTGIMLLGIFPAILLPSIVMAARPSRRRFVGALVAWAVLAWLAVEAIVLMDTMPKDKMAYQLVLVHLGAGGASLASAFVLRRAGYRLLRHSA